MKETPRQANTALILSLLAVLMLMIAVISPSLMERDIDLLLIQIYSATTAFFVGLFSLTYSRKVLIKKKDEVPLKSHQRAQLSMAFALMVVFGVCICYFWIGSFE